MAKLTLTLTEDELEMVRLMARWRAAPGERANAAHLVKRIAVGRLVHDLLAARRAAEAGDTERQSAILRGQVRS
ncbi:hypothetical protein ACF064_01420 [Streptomyces sp. NPDC015492]|uniref:hypothetical protein n=1 Tax=Streptomyces sp. NPDC015492 TaxID=3364958 RepID=UPI0036FCDD62